MPEGMGGGKGLGGVNICLVQFVLSPLVSCCMITTNQTASERENERADRQGGEREELL